MKASCRLFLLIVIASTTMVSFKCKKDATDSFCATERRTYFSFQETEGIVGYSEKYKRYIVIFETYNPSNIDELVAGFPCDLDTSLKVTGKTVTISGTLKEFNKNENITPEIGGEKPYFLEISTIKPKQ